MSKQQTLQNVANCFRAADQVLKMRNTRVQDGPEASVKPAPIPLMGDALRTIAEYAPQTHRGSLTQSADVFRLYGETFMNLKQHFSAVRSQQPTRHDVVKTLRLLLPILNEKQKLIVDKILKINEIL